MKQYEQIDDAIQVLLHMDPTMRSFTAGDLAAILGESTPSISSKLQVHRDAQRRGFTEFVAVGRGNGRAAEWYLLAGPGIATGNGERLTLGHAAHIAQDLRRRALSDIHSELTPGVTAHPAIQVSLTAMAAHIEAAVVGMVNAVNASLDLIEATTGIVPDRSGVVV